MPSIRGSSGASVVEGVRGSGVDVSGVTVGGADEHDLASLARQSRHIGRRWCGWWIAGSSRCRRGGQGLDLVIRRCGGRLRVVLLTRCDPPLPLNRYRLDGLITDIRAADLAFSTARGGGVDAA